MANLCEGYQPCFGFQQPSDHLGSVSTVLNSASALVIAAKLGKLLHWLEERTCCSLNGGELIFKVVVFVSAKNSLEKLTRNV